MSQNIKRYQEAETDTDQMYPETTAAWKNKMSFKRGKIHLQYLSFGTKSSTSQVSLSWHPNKITTAANRQTNIDRCSIREDGQVTLLQPWPKHVQQRCLRNFNVTTSVFCYDFDASALYFKTKRVWDYNKRLQSHNLAWFKGVAPLNNRTWKLHQIFFQQYPQTMKTCQAANTSYQNTTFDLFVSPKLFNSMQSETRYPSL